MFRTINTLLTLTVVLTLSASIASAQGFGFKIGGFRVSTSSSNRTPRVQFTPPKFNLPVNPPITTYPVKPPVTKPPVTILPITQPPVKILPIDPISCIAPRHCSTRPITICRPVTTAVASKGTPTRELEGTSEIRQLADAAKAAFQRRNYVSYKVALQAADKMVKLAPKDSDVLQFRSMIYFAMGEYQSAARDAYDAILVGPLWSTAAVKDLYQDADGHNRDLGWLRSAAKDQPQSLQTHFLLAYHELVLGNLQAGATELETVLRIKSDEPVSQKLLQVVQSQLQKNSEVASVAAR